MLVDYEEKTFESFFNSSLCEYAPFPPYAVGQRREGYIGFDASFCSSHPKLWGCFHCGSPRIGVPMRDIYDFFNLNIGNISIEANIIFQYKRPEYMKRQDAAEWNFWKQKYFRYKIYHHQQEILEKIHNEFARRAVVLYVSPTAIDERDLVSLVERGELISSSNFTEAIRLKNHNCNTYVGGNGISQAFSVQNIIHSFDFTKYIISGPQITSENVVNFLRNTEIKITNIMRHDSIYGRLFKLCIDNMVKANASRNTISRCLDVISIFTKITGVQWGFKVRIK